MAFKITVQPSGNRFEAQEGELILDAALEQGLNFPYGCRSGGCGNCMGTLIEGEIDYPRGIPPGLSDAQQEARKALFCQAVAESNLVIEVAEINATDGIVVKKLPARVVTMKRLCHDVMLVELKLPASQRLQFLAGQYIDILLKDGRKRAFSLANAPHDDEVLQLHIRKVDGGFFTTQVFEEMEEKSLLRIEGPLGSFFLREDSGRDVILLAGGTGFAPAKSIIEHAIAGATERTIYLYWGVKSHQDLYLGELATEWDQQNPNFHFIPVLSEESGERWKGRTGWVHEAVLDDFAALSDVDVYMSGPPQMILAAKQAFLERGLPEQQCYSDSFEYARDETR